MLSLNGLVNDWATKPGAEHHEYGNRKYKNKLKWFLPFEKSHTVTKKSHILSCNIDIGYTFNYTVNSV